jgi:hypothetical protein
MADYVGNCRTNWVKVKKDKSEDFKDFFNGMGQCMVNFDPATGKHAVFDHENDIPFSKYNEDSDDYEEVDWKPLADCLEDGEVLHWVGVGQEKMRYLEGVGFFIMSNGETVLVNINEPPPKVKEFMNGYKKQPTPVAY